MIYDYFLLVAINRDLKKKKKKIKRKEKKENVHHQRGH